MNTSSRKFRRTGVAIAAAIVLLAGCAGTDSHQGMGMDQRMHLTLTGANEVPPVTAGTTAMGMIMVGADRSVSGKIMAPGVNGTMAHIHLGPVGQNGPVIIPLTRSGSEWLVPPGAMLTDGQYSAYRQGNLYVNVHTDANKGGEVRAQLRP